MRIPLAKHLPALALSLLMLLQAGCNEGGSDNAGGAGGGDNPPPTTNAPAPAPTPVGTPDGAPASASIGVAGGTITTPDGKAKLTIPPDALAEVTTITLQPISNNAHGGLGKAFRLTPEGQTFAKPVQLTFTYTDEDLVGTSANALGIAFQQTDGLWQWVKYPVVNAVDRTVTVETTHFSDWSLVEGYLLRPGEATVQAGKTLALHVAFCYAPRPSEQDPVILGYQCDGEYSDTYIVTVDEWSVNGVPGGNGSTGTVTTTGGGGDAATYTAPATKPNPATVSVSALVDPADLGTSPEVELVISNITITEPSGDYAGTVQFDNTFASGTAQVTWKKVAEENGVTLYQAIGSMHITTHVDGCQNQELSFPLISNGNPSEVAYKLMVYPESHPEYPQQYAFELVGEGSDIAMQCAGSTFTYPARMFTTVAVGMMSSQNICPNPQPTYSDKSQLVGNWSCPPMLNNASWTFTAQ